MSLPSEIMSRIMISEEERQELENREALRRQGERFIRLRYHQPAHYDSVRIHGAIQITVDKHVNPITQEETYKKRVMLDGLLVCHAGLGGYPEADVWDDPEGRNRHWIKSQVLDHKFTCVDQNDWDEIVKSTQEEYDEDRFAQETMVREHLQREKELRALGLLKDKPEPEPAKPRERFNLKFGKDKDNPDG